MISETITLANMLAMGVHIRVIFEYPHYFSIVRTNMIAMEVHKKNTKKSISNSSSLNFPSYHHVYYCSSVKCFSYYNINIK